MSDGSFCLCGGSTQLVVEIQWLHIKSIQIEEVVGKALQPPSSSNNLCFQLNAETNLVYFPMHQIFLCKCGWLLYDPTTLLCGHTMCKHCADKNMFCLICGITFEVCCNQNLFLVELIRNWYPKEYIGTGYKKDAKTLYESKDYELALNKINLTIDLMHDDYFSFNIRAKIYIELKEFKLALADANKSCQLNKECGETQLIRGTCYSHLRNLDGAIDAFQLCLELAPEDMDLSAAVINKLDEILSLPPDVSKKLDADVENEKGSEFESNTEDELEPFLDTKHDCINIKETSDSDKPSSSKASADKDKKIKSDNEQIYDIPKNLIKEEDFECKLCYEILYKPITTLCGHVFCKSCLLRTLDHNPVCPICRFSLAGYYPLKAITILIEKLLEIFFNEPFSLIKKRHQERLSRLSRVGEDEQVEVPIFLCSIAFPYVKCPLHIFEPKYRLMIRECLESGSRKFGMCIPQSGGEIYSDIGTICEVINVKTLPDGRYIIDAVAGQRFLILERLSIDSTNYAKVKYFKDEAEDLTEEGFLTTSKRMYDYLNEYVNSLKFNEQNCIFNALGVLPKYESDFSTFEHGVDWVWWGLAALPLNFVSKLELLRSKCVRERMLSLERFLKFLTNMTESLTSLTSRMNTRHNTPNTENS